MGAESTGRSVPMNDAAKNIRTDDKREAAKEYVAPTLTVLGSLDEVTLRPVCLFSCQV
jgi:nicotinamide riboside kinase